MAGYGIYSKGKEIMNTDTKKHVLFLITSLKYGGAERVVANLSHSFAEKGEYRVTVMLLERKIDLPVEGVEMVSLHTRQKNLFDKSLSIMKDPFRLRRFIKDNGVDIVLSFMQRPNAINMLTKALGSKHTACVNVRCSMTRHYENVRPVIRSAGRLFFKWLWRYADRTIANSRVIKGELSGLFDIAPFDIDVIYNPMQLGKIENLSKEAIEEEWFKDKDTPIIINVGRMARAKGHKYLLRAFASLTSRRKARLAIIGDGELKEEIVKEARDLGVDDKVFFMGYRKNPYKYIARSDIFVLSSIYEGFPNVLIEAMACRCPVVSTYSFSGPAEILIPQQETGGGIVEARYGILVKEASEDHLSRAIEYLLDRKDLSAGYAERGYEVAAGLDISYILGHYEVSLSKASESKRCYQS